MDFLTDDFLVDPAAFDGPVLVTGAGGCIGGWAVAILHRSGVPCVAFDLADDRRRPALVMGKEAAADLVWEAGDITDGAAFRELVEKRGIRAIIHLAGLQVPFCKADPARGARVNVEGTINVLEAARHAGVRRTLYASSTAAHGMPPGGPNMATLYGAYKLANEYTAQVYWLDWGVPSVGVRPNVVYGVGRDQGMTSKFTTAILAAALGRPYEIPYRGPLSFLYAGEAAAACIAAVSRDGDGAPVFDLNGPCETVDNALKTLKALESEAEIAASGDPIAIPQDLSDEPIRAHLGGYPSVSVADGIAATHQAFKALIAEGRLDGSRIA